MNVKKSIAQTFIELGNSDGFDNITINKIAKACNISRTAFYYHFEDIPDVINYYLNEKITEVMLECAKLGDVKKGIEHSTKSLLYNFPEYKKLLDSKWRIYAENYLYDNWIAFAERMFATNQKQIPITIEEKKFLTQFISGGICHYIVYGKHQELSAEVFAEQLSFMLKARLATMKKEN